MKLSIYLEPGTGDYHLTFHPASSQSNYSITRLPNDQIRASVYRPRFRDEKLFVEADGITVGHAGDEISCGHVEALRLDGAAVEELVRPLADFFPQAAQDPRCLLELGGGDDVLVDRVEQKAPEREHRFEHARAHADLRQAARERLGDDVLHERRDARGG